MKNQIALQFNNAVNGRAKKPLLVIKNLLVALAAAGVTLWLMSGSFAMPVVMGILVFSALQRMSKNRKEFRVDDATRKSVLGAIAPAGQALLYIYREGFVGKLVGWDVTLDGTALAQLRSPRFTQTTLRPGPHTLAVGLSAGSDRPGEATFEAQPGEVIVFAMKSKSNALTFVREQDAHTVLQKLSKVPMVAAERAAGTAAA